jgi:hypothetical protein
MDARLQYAQCVRAHVVEDDQRAWPRTRAMHPLDRAEAREAIPYQELADLFVGDVFLDVSKEQFSHDGRS